MAGETIELKYVLNAGQARKDLAALDADTNRVGDSASKAATGWGRFSESMKGAQQRLGPTAAAISGISAALGENAGQAGKAVAAAGQMAAAFGSGGPAGVAIVAMTLIVNQLQKAWEDELKAQDAAIEKQFAGTDAAGAGRRGIDARIAALRKELGGPETGAQAGARVQLEIDAAEKSLQVVLAARNAMKVDNTAAYAETRQQYEDQRNIIEGSIRRLEVLKGFEIAAAGSRNRTSPSSAARASAVDERDPSAPFLSGNAARRAQADRAAQAASDAADAALEADIDAGAARVQAARELEDTRTLVAKIGAEERLAIEKEAAAAAAAIAMTSISIVAGASQQFISDMISGQEHASERFGLAIMQQAGQALVSYGTQLAGKAVMDAFVAPPLAVAEGAAAVGLIGAGVALGGVAGGLSANMSGSASGSSSPAARERGASGGRSGGSSSSGSTNVTIIYAGASGPTAEQGAAAVDKAQKRNARRGR